MCTQRQANHCYSCFSYRGQVPAEAESNFLKKAASLDTYGVDPHPVKVRHTPGGALSPLCNHNAPLGRVISS